MNDLNDKVFEVHSSANEHDEPVITTAFPIALRIQGSQTKYRIRAMQNGGLEITKVVQDLEDISFSVEPITGNQIRIK